MAEDVLTELQREVLRLFFALPESGGFVLAGGAALVASGLSNRPTGDVDLFGSDRAVGVAVIRSGTVRLANGPSSTAPRHASTSARPCGSIVGRVIEICAIRVKASSPSSPP